MKSLSYILVAVMLLAACSTLHHAPMGKDNSGHAYSEQKSVVNSGGYHQYPVATDPSTTGPAMDFPAPNIRLLPEQPIAPPPTSEQPFSTEDYSKIDENPYLAVGDAPLSTFSIDVDTASYSNVRRFLHTNNLPPKDSVRIEELINYFDYDYPDPHDEKPFSVVTEVGECPWNPAHGLVHIGIQGKRLHQEQIPPCNLVFLIDVSGSMNSPNKLPLLKTALAMLVERMRSQDRIAIVVYAGSSGVVLPSTSASAKHRILESIARLSAAGSTNAGEGIQLAYRIAETNFIESGVNRIILATDGDFNVGITSKGDLVRLVEEKRQTGVSLSILGFGMGNYKDSMLEQLTNRGDGSYAYIDNLAEARKAMATEVTGTLATIARDVKIQVEFNPLYVKNYRLIGYENRVMRDEDFNDDNKDAGEIGAGHTVTALYEIVPVGPFASKKVDPLRYQSPRSIMPRAESEEILFVKVRYKHPEGGASQLLTMPVRLPDTASLSPDFRFSAAVATFGMILRDSPHRGNASFNLVRSLATNAVGRDIHGYRKDFLDLVETASALWGMSNR